MGELGQKLRQAREAKKVSLAEIAAQTRIGVRLLQAIETEQLDHLPGGVFNKSFLRQYASFLGLEQEPFVQAYLRQLEPPPETPEEAPKPATSLPEAVIGSPWLRWTLASACVALLVTGIWSLLSKNGSSNQTPRATALPEIVKSVEPATPPAPSLSDLETEEPAEASPSPLASPAAIVPAAEPPSAPDPAVSAEPAPAPAVTEPVATPVPPSATLLQAVDLGDGEVLVLQINARSTVWLSITADGEKLWQGTLQPEQSREVEASDSIRVTVGNAGGVEMTLNGESLGALGQEGEVRTITLAAEGTSAPAF
jgi:cytoskeleton protein RodZ